MAARHGSSPSLSPEQKNSLLRQAQEQHKWEYFEAITNADVYDTWELVAREFLQTPCEIKAFLTLAEPKQGRTIGHIAAEEKDEALWAILLDIGDGYPGEFSRLLGSRDACGKTVEQRIRACGAPRLSEMLDEYLGENNKNTK